MHLKNIRLQQFKNYKKEEVHFSEEINCFVGINGSGKTNLLDAIHYLCLTKSALNPIDNLNIKHEQNFFTVFGDFDLNGKEIEIRCLFESGKKKQVLKNGKAYDKMSEHIGLLPVVMIAPDDTSLIKDGSEERRKFFDNILCQLNRKYLENLIRYQHFLKQRNALIKQFAEKGRWNEELIEPYTREVIQLSKNIASTRHHFLEEYEPLLMEYYKIISGGQEKISIQYESQCLQEDFEAAFRSNAQKDYLLRRSTMGIHKDDFVFQISEYPIKKFGSQGQQKSFIIALKLAQFMVFFKHLNTKPILLLDDIFDKLDDSRIEKLMKLVAEHEFGQLFITDARPERSQGILTRMDADCRFFFVNQGKIEGQPQ